MLGAAGSTQVRFEFFSIAKGYVFYFKNSQHHQRIHHSIEFPSPDIHPLIVAVIAIIAIIIQTKNKRKQFQAIGKASPPFSISIANRSFPPQLRSWLPPNKNTTLGALARAVGAISNSTNPLNETWAIKQGLSLYKTKTAAQLKDQSGIVTYVFLSLARAIPPHRTHTKKINTHTKKNSPPFTDTLNGGTVWNGQSGAPSSSARWQGVASSADGTKLIAADQTSASGNLWFSSNSGATFAAQTAGLPVPTLW